LKLRGQLGGAVSENMADFYSSDSELTTRTLLRRVLDTADSLTPRRRRSAQAGYVSVLHEQLEGLGNGLGVGASANPVWTGKVSPREGQNPEPRELAPIPEPGSAQLFMSPIPEAPGGQASDSKSQLCPSPGPLEASKG
jgi:hypothetical protein